jgi:tungstate transport system substrate-binding protein
MGAVLQISHDKSAYTLTDRGTYLAYKNKINLEIAYEGDRKLFNPYHVILLNPQKHPHVKSNLAQHYANFIRGTEGQTIIANFKVNDEALFHADVMK